MGMSAELTRADNWRVQREPVPGANSHVANRNLEYTVFKQAQIIPCYVIHMDWGPDNAKYFGDIPTDAESWVIGKRDYARQRLRSNTVEDPGNKVRRKQALLAKGAKYFAYGHGPSNHVVVEDVGDVDEDEEDFGEYQKDRVNATLCDPDPDIWDWLDDTTAPDERHGSGQDTEDGTKTQPDDRLEVYQYDETHIGVDFYGYKIISRSDEYQDARRAPQIKRPQGRMSDQASKVC